MEFLIWQCLLFTFIYFIWPQFWSWKKDGFLIRLNTQVKQNHLNYWLTGVFWNDHTFDVDLNSPEQYDMFMSIDQFCRPELRAVILIFLLSDINGVNI